MDYINNSVLTIQQDSYLNQLLQSMKEVMPPPLYAHTLGTLSYSFKLASLYLLKNGKKSNINTFFKLCISCILHDYGKIFTYEELVDIARANKLNLTDFELGCKPILHSLVGDYLAARDYNIVDSQILKAIRCHTVGCTDMSLMEKILFISDKIEETRNYQGLAGLRQLSCRDLDRCLIEVYKNNIIFNVSREHQLHPDTSIIWNNICGGKPK